ncbi:MAG: hypothetical protein V4808_07325, partial [Pseudomonadota bacterium]
MIAAPVGATVPACVNIPNVARLSFAEGGVSHILASNVAAVRTAELLDLRLAVDSNALAVAQGVTGPVPVMLTNSGNGDEAFVLDARIEGSGATLTGFAIDRDGNGRFDAAIDTAMAIGDATPMLAPGASVAVLALVEGSASVAAGTLTITARARTGSGTPGTGFAGEGGCDAVVGASGAIAV